MYILGKVIILITVHTSTLLLNTQRTLYSHSVYICILYRLHYLVFFGNDFLRGHTCTLLTLTLILTLFVLYLTTLTDRGLGGPGERKRNYVIPKIIAGILRKIHDIIALGVT